jgi:hypothetical protein
MSKRTGQEWLELVKQWEGSGLSRREWCQEQGIPKAKFGYWVAKVKVPTELKKEYFVELRDSVATTATLEIQYYGASIFLPMDFEAVSLQRCLKVLQEHAC